MMRSCFSYQRFCPMKECVLHILFLCRKENEMVILCYEIKECEKR